MVRCMCSHKCLEHGIKNLIDVMTRAGVPHAAQMNVISGLHGGRDNGRDNWMFTEQDF
jgi:hypothetical protein